MISRRRCLSRLDFVRSLLEKKKHTHSKINDSLSLNLLICLCFVVFLRLYANFRDFPFVIFSRRVNLNNKVLREVNKKTEVKKRKKNKKQKTPWRKEKNQGGWKSHNYQSNWRKLGIISSSSRSG